MSATPPRRRINPQFDAQKLTEQEQQGNATAVAERIREIWKTLQSTEPSVEHFLNLDWRIRYPELPEKAKELIDVIVKNCHVSTLQVILQLARKRILDDYQLWSFLKEVEETLQLGDKIYGKRRIKGNNVW
jgi:hypothetical protein